MSQRRARRRDLRLAPVVGVAWIAAGVTTWHPELAAGMAVALWIAAVAAVGCGLRAPGAWRTAAAVLAICAAGGAAVSTHVALAQPSRSVLAELPLDGGRALELRATVVGKVERTATGWRMDAIAHDVALGDEHTPVNAPVIVQVGEPPSDLDLGAAIDARGTAAPGRPGSRAVVVVYASALSVRDPPQGILASASALRTGLHDVMRGLPQPAAGLVAGLSVGDTSAVTDDLDADMKTTSLSHLTAVSGANCALVVGIAFLAAAWCGAPRALRVVVGLVTLVGFVVLVSPEPSVVRAGAMAVVALLGVLLGRIGAGVSILAVSVVVLLVLDPWLAGSIGFALSAAATGALLLAAGPLADGLARWMPEPLALAISVPLAAQLACGPLLVLITPTVPLYGVVANLLAAPAAPAATVLGLAACLTAGIPLVGDGLAAVAWLPAAWIAATAQTLAALPAGTAPWIDGWPGVVALAVVGVAIGVGVAGRPVWARAPAFAIAALAVCGLIGAGPVAGLIERARVPGDWAVAMCDVGQGDAVLVRSAGRTVLIDTGPDPGLLRACLDLFGVDRLDLVVITHFDLDHHGGSPAVLGRTDVVWHGPPDTPADETLLAEFAAGGADVVPATAGMAGRFGDSRWRVLWPRAGGRTAGNDASVVVEWARGGIPDALFLGDLSAETQRAVRRELTGAGYALVKVSHHGSADQDAGLYRAAHPALALIGVGENTYGHPREEILGLLQSLGAAIGRTDTDGAIAVRVGEDGILHVWRQRADVPAAE